MLHEGVFLAPAQTVLGRPGEHIDQAFGGCGERELIRAIGGRMARADGSPPGRGGLHQRAGRGRAGGDVIDMADRSFVGASPPCQSRVQNVPDRPTQFDGGFERWGWTAG